MEIFDIISYYTTSLYNLVADHSRLSNEETGTTYKSRGTADQILLELLEKLEAEDVLLICGSFYVMKDIALFFRNSGIDFLPFLSPEDFHENN